MTVRSLVSTLALASSLALAVVPVRADEDASAHTKHPMRTVVLDNEQILPSDTTMAVGDVLVFENHSINLMRVTFIPPPDLKTQIRCGWTTQEEAKRPPWGLFSFEGDRLVGLIPPGRFASVCTFAAGKYAFLVRKENASVDVATGTLENKGTLTVQ